MATAIKLYELADARDILDEWFAEHEGEVTPELEELLNLLEGQTNEKIERVALYVREQLATAKAIKEEEDRLVARRKAKERAAEGLKTYLHGQMARLGSTKVDGLLCTVAVQKNSVPSVRCDLDEDALRALHDGGFLEVERRVSYVLDTRGVAAMWKEGKAAQIPAGISVEQGTHLRIR